jgi:hypothetical protein
MSFPDFNNERQTTPSTSDTCAKYADDEERCLSKAQQGRKASDTLILCGERNEFGQ